MMVLILLSTVSACRKEVENIKSTRTEETA